MSISREAASFVQNIANVILVFSLALGVIATFTSVWMGSVKEEYMRHDLAEASARIEEARASAAKANARAAEANQKAEEERLARIKIEERLAPRSLTDSQRRSIVAKIQPFAPQQFEFASYQDDQEVRGLVLMLIKTLLSAGWVGQPARVMLMAGLVIGVVVEFAPGVEDELGSAAHALAVALNAEGIAASVAVNPEMTSHPDRLRIKVGKKP